MSKFPSFSQWKQIFKVLRRGEKITLSVLMVLAATSLAFLVISFYFANTKVVPALGGKLTEGVVGQPRFVNPIYGETNDVDRGLIDVMFSGLMKYDNHGQIVEDLTDTYTVSSDGKTYDIKLKNNLFWDDGKPLTADDVMFTIKTIQNSDYKSPLRANWIGVTAQKVSNNEVQFILRSPYNAFLETLTTKIIPQHIWENVSAENFAISSYNLQPVGSGPFQFLNIDQTNTGLIKQIDLTSNRRYYQPSFIQNLSFQFFENKDDLEKALNAGQVQAFTLASLDNNEAAAEKQINQGWFNSTHFLQYTFSLPRYFAVFFNPSPAGQKSGLLSDPNIRQALSYAVNKQALVNKIKDETRENIDIVDSPILPEFFGYQSSQSPYEFDIDQAKVLLDKAGFKDDGSGVRAKSITKKPAFQFNAYLKIGSKGTQVTQLQACLSKLDDSFKTLLAPETNGTFGKPTDAAVTAFQKKYLPDTTPTGETGSATRTKLNELCAPPSSNTQPLQLTITTINQPQLVEVANMLKDYWGAVGVQVTINALSVADIKQAIKARNYDALLYGEALGADPDLYPFWHSSQVVDPGLNLAEYNNKNADKLLQEARETSDASVKEKDYESLQTMIMNDAPALFLYNPDYIYWVSTKVRGVDTTKIIDPAKRFSNISNWYIQTKRVWK